MGVALFAAVVAYAPQVRLTTRSSHRATATMSISDIVTGWQPAALSKVVDTLNLTPNEYAEEMGFASFSMAGATGKVESFDGPGVPNVAWCSGLQLCGMDTARASVAAFCGPLSDVPHLIASCGISGEPAMIDIYIDWRPRAEAAYDAEFGNDVGAYPSPETREAFAEGGNRKDFAAAFFTPDAEAWRSELLALGSEGPKLTKEEQSTISAGPLIVDMRLPLTEESATAAAQACEQAVDRWMTWMTSVEEMKRELPAGMRQTATYTRDTKVRANHFGFLLNVYKEYYGDADGTALAKADAGPLDEAYVGGGS